MGGQEKKKKKTSNRRAGNDIELVDVLNLMKPEGLDLMQNCDLPPPSKIFMGGSDKIVMLSMNMVCNNSVKILGKEQGCDLNSKNEFEFVDCGNEGNVDDDKVELLKALRSWQTRVRQAKKKVVILRKKKEWVSDALLGDAMKLFAYRQQLRLLQLQVSNLQSLYLLQQQQRKGC